MRARRERSARRTRRSIPASWERLEVRPSRRTAAPAKLINRWVAEEDKAVVAEVDAAGVVVADAEADVAAAGGDSAAAADNP